MQIPLPFYAPLDSLPGLQLNELIEYLFIFFLSSIRLSSFLLSSPFLGSRNIPLSAKIVFSMVLSFFNFGYVSDFEINNNLLDTNVLFVLEKDKKNKY